MIPFDQLRSALLGPEPHRVLDRMVTAELAAGRKTTQIYDELLGHIEAVRAIPGYTDELEDPLGDTLDALCGWCHPDSAYKDLPEATALPVAPNPTVASPNPLPDPVG